jgi:hypothetical protein
LITGEKQEKNRKITGPITGPEQDRVYNKTGPVADDSVVDRLRAEAQQAAVEERPLAR